MFAAGGMVAAMLIPMHLFVAGLAVPLGLLNPDTFSYESML